MSQNLASPPLQTDVTELRGSKVTRVWGEWWFSLMQRVQAAAYAAQTIAAVDQAASIAATNLIVSPSAGLYRITFRFRVTQAATVSSSLSVTVTATDGGVACALTSTAYTGNVVNQPQTGTVLVRSDNGVPITYAATYASVGATPAIFDLDVIAEAL